MRGTGLQERLAPRSGGPAQTFLVFDSGVGGLTVQRAIARARPDARCVYVADDAAFPYGALPDDLLVQRVCAVIAQMDARYKPDCIVIACNTASTLVLPALRAALPVPVVGTVPAIKPAAKLSANKLFAVLATPGTVKRDYTRDLIAQHAPEADVVLVGARGLADLAERWLQGEIVDDAQVRHEIAGCFVSRIHDDGREIRTDVVTLSCTHYPLLLPLLQRAAPWPVMWIDPAPAIARRVVQLMGATRSRVRLVAAGDNVALFTSDKPVKPALHAALRARISVRRQRAYSIRSNADELRAARLIRVHNAAGLCDRMRGTERPGEDTKGLQGNCASADQRTPFLAAGH